MLFNLRIKRFFKGAKASYLHGRGIARFYQKRYQEAMLFLEEAFELDPTKKHNDLSCSYLGRIYLTLENYDKALELLSISYELFSSRKQSLLSDFERKEFIDTLKAYSYVLGLSNQREKAKKIEHEIDEINETIKKGIG